MRRLANILFFTIIALTHGGLEPAQRVGATPPQAGGSEQAVAIIVNQSNPVENFSFDDLRKIFLGERSHWPNGRRITLVMLDPSQPERKAVLRDIYGMSEKDFNNHFIQGVFSGAVFVSREISRRRPMFSSSSSMSLGPSAMFAPATWILP